MRAVEGKGERGEVSSNICYNEKFTFNASHLSVKCFPQSGWCDGREDCVKGEDEAVCTTMTTLCQDYYDYVDGLPRRPPPAVIQLDRHGMLHVTGMSSDTAALNKV